MHIAACAENVIEITRSLLEVHWPYDHVLRMTRSVPMRESANDPNRTAAPSSAKPLGIRAPGRQAVDLVLEAQRLKFSETEIRELERIYGHVGSLGEQIAAK
jgi:hypothetical protein